MRACLARSPARPRHPACLQARPRQRALAAARSPSALAAPRRPVRPHRPALAAPRSPSVLSVPCSPHAPPLHSTLRRCRRRRCRRILWSRASGFKCDRTTQRHNGDHEGLARGQREAGRGTVVGEDARPHRVVVAPPSSAGDAPQPCSATPLTPARPRRSRDQEKESRKREGRR